MSFTTRTALVAALSAFASAQTGPAPKLTANCDDVVLFMARGNDAPYHDSRTFPVVESTCAKLKAQGTSCDYMDIQFDVTLGGNFCNQIQEGARNGISQITSFNAKCPNTKIVINGYSEGSNVVGDVLGGASCDGTTTSIDSNSAAGKAIVAALVWGDVRHTANQPYNVLDGAGLDNYPRTGRDLELLNRYASVLRSYCAAGDPVCAGGNDVAQHLNYFDLYTDDATSWIVSQFNKLKPTSSSSSSMKPTSTPTPSSSATSSAAASGIASSVSASSVSGTASSASGTASFVTGTASSGFSIVTSSKASNGTATVPGSGYASASASSLSSASVSIITSIAGSTVAQPSYAPTATATAHPYTPVHPADPAFPAPVDYDACVVVYEFEFVHA